MSGWKDYEEKIFDKFGREFPGATITENDYIWGQFSKIKRQVDISIRGKLAGKSILVVVDCKYFSKKVDVKVIDSFVGFLEDVKANLGVLITNEGFSKAAKNRAKVRDIRLDVVKFDELERYKFTWDECHICDPGSDKPPGIIDWGIPYGIEEEGITSIIDFGRCNRCNSIQIRCQVCGAITPIYENSYGKSVDCDGGCGLKFKIVSQHIGEGMYEEHCEIVQSSNH